MGAKFLSVVRCRFVHDMLLRIYLRTFCVFAFCKFKICFVVSVAKFNVQIERQVESMNFIF